MSDPTWTVTVPERSGQLVTVREVRASDAAWLFELLSDPAVTTHLSQPPPSADAFAGFIAWAQRGRAEGKSICFGIVPQGLTAAVGIVQIRALEPSWFAAEWGFALGAAFWGTGIFVEAASLVAEFAFTTLGVHRIAARAVTDNARGHAAVQKLGAVAEGILSKAFRKDGRLDQQLLWSITKADWEGRDRNAVTRVTSAEARHHIAQAITETDRLMARLPRQEPSSEVTPYPFFLTDSKSWGTAVRERKAVATSAAPSAATVTGKRARPRVLLIDDNVTHLDLYEMVVQEVADVVRASRGEEGYQLACRELPDLVVMDVLMPDVNGLTVAKRLRANRQTTHLPIVILTGDAAAYAQAQIEGLAFSAILTKPCPASVLLGVVKAATVA